MYAERCGTFGPDDSFFVGKKFNNGSHKPPGTNAVTPHKNELLLPFFVKIGEVKCLRIFRAERKDIAYFNGGFFDESFVAALGTIGFVLNNFLIYRHGAFFAEVYRILPRIRYGLE